MLTAEQYHAFALEISTFGNIPISSRNCRIGCIYCKVHQDPILKRFPSLPDISIDDLYQGYQYINETHNYVRLGAGVLVASHTDPYLHPEIFNFIKHTSEYFPNKKITTVTTGSYIKENKIDYLHRFHNFGIDLSLVTMQAQRETIIPNATRKRIDTLLREAPIRKISLMFTGDIDALKRDLDLLFSLNWHIKAKEILVRRIEQTKFSNDTLNSISSKSIKDYGSCVKFLSKSYPKIVFTVPVLENKFRGGSNEYFSQAEQRLSNLKERFSKEKQNFFQVICSPSGFRYFKKNLESFENVKVNLIKNDLYGGSVTVSGLLNHHDIFKNFKLKRKGDIIVLPYEMYDSRGCEITGNHISELKTFYNTDVWVA